MGDTLRFSAALALLVAPFLLTACAAPVPAPPVPEPDPTWNRELHADRQLEPYDYEETPNWVVMRVVDAETGLPLPGATIDNWYEADVPHAEPWEPLLEQSAVTDIDGFAFLHEEPRGNWIYVSAPDYAPFGVMSFERDYALERGEDIEVEIRDWLDRPVADVFVDVQLGCGHTPMVQSGTTDARGRVTLRCLDPEAMYAWLKGDGISGITTAYGRGLERDPDLDGRALLRAGPGPALEGRILRADGTPAANAVVGTRSYHRGPWTRTDEQGRYRLLGVEPRDILTVYDRAPPGSPPGTPYTQAVFRTVPGVRPTVTLPKPNRDSTRWERDLPPVQLDVGDVTVPVVVRSSDPATTFERVRLVAVRESDGFAVVEDAVRVDSDAALDLALFEGTWSVTAGSAAGVLRPETRTIEVHADRPPTVEFDLSPNPVWAPEVYEVFSDGTRRRVANGLVGYGRDLKVISEDGVVEAVPSSTVDGGIHVPADGPFAIQHYGWPADTTHRVFDGVPGPEDGTFVVHGKDPWRPTPRSDTPPPPGTPTLTVLKADGTPAVGAYVTLHRGGAGEEDPVHRRTNKSGRIPVEFGPGTSVKVEYYGNDEDDIWLPLEVALEGPGPWTVGWPERGLNIRAVDEKGDPLPWFTVSYRGQWYYTESTSFEEGQGGVVTLWIPDSRTVRMFVTDEDYLDRDLRLHFDHEGLQDLPVTMRRDPRSLAAEAKWKEEEGR